jgi:hypothetical protein
MMPPIQNRCDCCADYDAHCIRCNPVRPVQLWKLLGCGALAVFVVFGLMAVGS